MPEVLKLKPSQKAIREYFADLATHRDEGADKETTLRTAFFRLLDHCARKLKWHINTEYGLSGEAQDRSVEVAVLDDLSLPRGYCEAKDDQDDLDREIEDKFEKHYPETTFSFGNRGGPSSSRTGNGSSMNPSTNHGN